MAPGISVLMRVGHIHDFLMPAVNSILKSNLNSEYELLILPIGCNSESMFFLKNLKNPHIRVIDSSNCDSLAMALNRGMDHAHFDYIAIMDSDDLSSPDRLQSQLDFLNCHKDISIVGSQVRFIDQKGEVVKHSEFPQSNKKIRSLLKSYSCIVHPSVMFRKTSIISIGGYSSEFAYAHDYELWLRARATLKFHNLNEKLIDYRVHEMGVSSKYKSRQDNFALLAKSQNNLLVKLFPRFEILKKSSYWYFKIFDPYFGLRAFILVVVDKSIKFNLMRIAIRVLVWPGLVLKKINTLF
jgi:glycosyltransferase involved in cell wall biosynthesis